MNKYGKYYNKYLKYKFKYNMLKNMKGGDTIKSELENIEEKLYIKNILTVNLERRKIGETSQLNFNLQEIKDLENQLIKLNHKLDKFDINYSDEEIIEKDGKIFLKKDGKLYLETEGEKHGRFTLINYVLTDETDDGNSSSSSKSISSADYSDENIYELEEKKEELEDLILKKKREWDNDNKSYGLIDTFLKANPGQYLNWYLWTNISTESPSEFNKKDPKYNEDFNIFQDDSYKLFSIENFLKGFKHENEKESTNFLEELKSKYDDSFSEWKDKPSFDNNKYVYVKKLKITEENAKICIIGDIHSSLHSLLSIIFKIKNDYFIDSEQMILKPDRYIVFLGDIIDRGPYSLELLMLIFCLKNYNFNNVFIINGNHEDYPIFSRDGTIEEYNNQYENLESKVDYLNLHSTNINKILNRLPSCIYLEFGGKLYHLSHGAFDPYYAGFIGDYSDLDQENFNQANSELYEFLQSDNTYDLVSENYVNNNYKWGDLSNNKYSSESSRGIGIYNFGHPEIEAYLKYFNISNIISGHQDLEPINFILYPKQISNIKKGSSPLYPLEFKISDIYSRHHGRLYQPNLQQFTTDKIKFDLHDNSYMALVTSTATVSRDMEYQGVYLELHKQINSKEGFQAGILSKRCNQCGKIRTKKEWDENGCDICLNHKIMIRTSKKKIKRLRKNKDLLV